MKTLATEKNVSICIPTYNNGKYIGSTLESLMCQTHKNIEIIVSDNASTDNTKEIVLEKQLLDKRIIYSRNSENIGYVKNIEIAINLSSFNIIAIYHSDDLYDPSIIEKELKVLNEKESIVAVFTRLVAFKENYNDTVSNELQNILNIPFDSKLNSYIGKSDDFFPLFLSNGNFIACPSFMTRKKEYKKIGGFVDKYKTNEDLYLWIKYLKSGKKIAIINEALLKYRLSDGQGSAQWQKLNQIPIQFNVLDEEIVNTGLLSGLIVEKYEKRKVKTIFQIAMRSDITKQQQLTLCLESRNIIKFTIFSKIGFWQIKPLLFVFLRKIIMEVKNDYTKNKKRFIKK